MLQVENEYGSYGNDKVYLNKLKDCYLQNGLTGCLITADGASISSLERGYIDGCVPTFTFGSRTRTAMEMLQNRIGDMPAMCTEFWDGWFDHWYEEHHVRSVENICEEFEPFLEYGYNFNFYMFHGGTNFGFMNGANFHVPDGARFCDGQYKPTVTSYDYNALLSEAGDRTPAYYAVRDLINKYAGVKEELTATETTKRGYGKVKFVAQADLFDNLDNIGTKFYSTTPMSMEECGQNYGYMFYTTDLNANINSEFRIMDLSDRANVFVGKDPVAVFERNVARDTFYLVTGDKQEKLNVLIENMGRINYGSYVADKKGMAGVKLWEVQLFHWTNIALPMDNLEKLCYTDLSEKPSATPTFYKGTLFVDKAEDTFLKPSGFAKGFIVVNGVNIGRYYNAAGPQKTLYLPKCYLKDGENEIVIFDSDGASDLTLESVDTPEL
jgi:beta-galactosidase